MSKSVPIMSDAEVALRRTLAERMVIIDGAMGTTIRSYNITEQQARGERFKDAPKDLKNNGDIYSLTCPIRSATSIGASSTPARTSLRPTRFRHGDRPERIFYRGSAREGRRKTPAFYRRSSKINFFRSSRTTSTFTRRVSVASAPTVPLRKPDAVAMSRCARAADGLVIQFTRCR